MHVMLVADGRSPTSRHWVQAVLALGHQVSLVSTFPCEFIPGTQATYILPLAFAGMAGSQVAGDKAVPPAPRTFESDCQAVSLAVPGRPVLLWPAYASLLRSLF